ncbi:MAG: hypothetical protein O3B13_07385 [Planctomycetota bacterium]|nr:hypothetical protein [Planctomycetota bacterium]
MKFQKFSEQLEGFRNVDPNVRDQRLESDCLRLLSRLQVHLETLGAKSSQDDTNGALETGKELLVELLDFVTVRFGDKAVTSDLTRICELRDSMRELKRLLGRIFWAKLFRVESSHNEFRIQAYRQIGHDFADVLRDLLSVVDGHFNSREKAAEWQSSSRILIEDFRQRW